MCVDVTWGTTRHHKAYIIHTACTSLWLSLLNQASEVNPSHRCVNFTHCVIISFSGTFADHDSKFHIFLVDFFPLEHFLLYRHMVPFLYFFLYFRCDNHVTTHPNDEYSSYGYSAAAVFCLFGWVCILFCLCSLWTSQGKPPWLWALFNCL